MKKYLLEISHHRKWYLLTDHLTEDFDRLCLTKYYFSCKKSDNDKFFLRCLIELSVTKFNDFFLYLITELDINALTYLSD